MSVLEIAEMNGIGAAVRRTPQIAGAEHDRVIPSDALIVSADSHWLEPPDMWVERFPADLRDRAPRLILRDGAYEMETNGKVAVGPEQAKGFATFEMVAGINQIEPRLRDLDAEGVHAELLFPQRTFGLIRARDLRFREWCLRAYNQHLSEVCAGEPRLHGVGLLPWWELERTAEHLAELQDLGFRTAMVPIEPGLFPDGTPINWNEDAMDPFWRAVEASGMPLCFHIGENTKTAGQGAVGMFVLEQTGGFRNLWGALVFGGVFDRFPGLRIVFVEGGLSWVASALQDADMIYESFFGQISPKLAHSPSWYWHHHCYATFMVDPAGLELIHRIGAERAMWSSDYPHNESTLGYTRSAVAQVFAACTDADAWRIVATNAQELFGITV